MTTAFISGHLDLTMDEFKEHYIRKIDEALEQGVPKDLKFEEAPPELLMFRRHDVTVHRKKEKKRGLALFRSYRPVSNP